MEISENTGMRIVVSDSDAVNARNIAKYLTRQGFETYIAADAHDCLKLAEKNPHVIILNTLLENGSGFAVCQRLRQGSETPIVLLGKRWSDIDRAFGKQMGASALMDKPCTPLRLLETVESLLPAAPPEGITLGRLQIIPNANTIVRDGTEIYFSTPQMRLLHFLASFGGRPAAREEIKMNQWGKIEVSDKVLNNLVERTRHKLEPIQQQPRHLLTVNCYGYRLCG